MSNLQKEGRAMGKKQVLAVLSFLFCVFALTNTQSGKTVLLYVFLSQGLLNKGGLGMTVGLCIYNPC